MVGISLVGYVLGGGIVYGGRDIDVASVVLTLGWSGGVSGFVGLVYLTSSRSSSGLLFLGHTQSYHTKNQHKTQPKTSNITDTQQCINCYTES